MVWEGCGDQPAGGVRQVNHFAGSFEGIKSDHDCCNKGEDSEGRRIIMPEQFENPKEVKVKDEAVSELSAQQKIDHVADALAAKSAKTQQKFNKDNSNLFTK